MSPLSGQSRSPAPTDEVGIYGNLAALDSGDKFGLPMVENDRTLKQSARGPAKLGVAHDVLPARRHGLHD
jgi:hypothetical protein